MLDLRVLMIKKNEKSKFIYLDEVALLLEIRAYSEIQKNNFHIHGKIFRNNLQNLEFFFRFRIISADSEMGLKAVFGQ